MDIGSRCVKSVNQKRKEKGAGMDPKLYKPLAADGNDAYRVVLEGGRVGDVVAAYDKVCSYLPDSLLLNGIRQLCATPESFINVRQRFASSFAVLSICSYIIGLGDRHLGNFLINKSTGTCVGIDFGAAFGYGITLRVPELMPMRMTPQFTRFMQPLSSYHLYKQDMVQCLTALREHQRIILTIMEVFIKEPHLDWVNMSKASQSKTTKRPVSGGTASSTGRVSSSNAEYNSVSMQKIEVAKRKLQGDNCAAIMVSELETALKEKQPTLFLECKRIIRGLKDAKRAQRKWKRCKTVTEQVECLLDHSMDKNILGRTYHGWAPFI